MPKKVTSVRAGRAAAQFRSARLEFANALPTTEITMTLPVSSDDLVAALFMDSEHSTRHSPLASPLWRGASVEWLTDPARLPVVVMTNLLHEYRCVVVAREAVAAVQPGTPAWETVCALRAAVASVFGVSVPPQVLEEAA